MDAADKLQNFKSELKSLLEKYNASIWADLEGDTHGCSSQVVIEIEGKDYPCGEMEITQFSK